MEIFKISRGAAGEYRLFPEEVIQEAGNVYKYIELCLKKETEGNLFFCNVNNEKLRMPYRVYSDINNKILEGASKMQKIMIHCTGTRNWNGFTRQKHLEALLEYELLDWVIPYIIKICDEYVVEILEVVYEKLAGTQTDSFGKFMLENSKLAERSYARMVSYWNVYYRRKYPKLENYVGYKIFRECFGYCAKNILAV